MEASRKITERMSGSGGMSGSNFLRAVETGDIDMATKILGDNPEAVAAIDPSNGFTALHYACLTADSPMINFLIDRGAPATLGDAIGRLPIQLVVGLIDLKTFKRFDAYTFPENYRAIDPFEHGGLRAVPRVPKP